jgi:hypothetical protein
MESFSPLLKPQESTAVLSALRNTRLRKMSATTQLLPRQSVLGIVPVCGVVLRLHLSAQRGMGQKQQLNAPFD